ncbi:N-acetylglucosamine-6-phosphate deacetylase [Paracoccus sp. TK19116]|uniref:N-acetylglucosamine-6-phosphate deacetylase n=1 Tax=Paracoccus albicereus TaxID=2922394 RepID=A0ABT1MRD4_9RHOB|nr:N-acetylglucosamine-6-phosphate deacetylase [Paracoccus albicereus]MCQ0970872.1 N-acetylglucosamine-6-phosphate deacetylase [Paracoccus albicereus]
MILRGARIFDGERFHDDAALHLSGDRIDAIRPDDGTGEDLGDGILAPGFIDLQVNGGGGIMLDADTGVEGIARICTTHASLGATTIMPTLITDRPEATAAVIAAGVEAARQSVPGFAGLHLEGPHLDPRRTGAHDPALIRAMDDADLSLLVEAAKKLPALIVTLSPASATAGQIAALVKAGAIVSLGHAEATHDEALAAHLAGASMVTHLFNAMSQLGSREPGLVGSALSEPFDCGIIADGHHVDPATLALAMRAKTTGRMFLVSDAMAVAGTDAVEFTLGGRRILRGDGRLTLTDGTLAGADLSLPQAVGVMVRQVGVPVERALAMASSVPAAILGTTDRGRLDPGLRADLVHLKDDFGLHRAWQGGLELDVVTP